MISPKYLINDEVKAQIRDLFKTLLLVGPLAAS